MMLLAPLVFLGTLWGLPPVGVPWWAAVVPWGLGGAILVLARRPVHVVGGLVLLAISLGMLRTATAGAAAAENALAGAVARGEVAAVRGVVIDQPVPRERSQRVKLRADAVRDRGGEWHATSGYVQVTARPAPALRYQQILEVHGEIETPEAAAGSSYAAYLRRQGMDAVVAFPRLTHLGESQEGPPWRSALFGLRDRLAAGIETRLPEPQASLVEGILIGRRATIPEALNEQLSRSGTSHLIAVSGYNVSLVVGLAAVVATRGVRGRRLPVVLMASGTLWAFVLLVGASGSVLRAAAMAQLALAGRAFGRAGAAGGLLVWGSAVLGAVQPGLVHDVGWQLSFLGTAGLTWLSPAIGAGLGRLPPLLREGLAGSVAAQVFVLPVLAETFGRVSLVAPLANVLALPLVPPIMFLGAGAVLADALLPPAAPLLAALAWVPATGLIRVVEWSASWPGAEMVLPPWSPLATGTYVGGLATLCAALQWRTERGAHGGARAIPRGSAATSLLDESRMAAALSSGSEASEGRTAGGMPAGHPAGTAGGARLPAIILAALTALAVVGWQMVAPGEALAAHRALHLAVPAVPDGTLALLRAPEGARVLFNGGPGASSATTVLGEQLRPWDRTVDAVVLADPREASVLGLPRALERYRTGVFIDAAAGYPSGAYRQVQATAQRHAVPHVRAEAGSAIAIGSAVRLEVLKAESAPAPGSEQGPSSGLTGASGTSDAAGAHLTDLPAWRLCWGDFSVLIPGDGSSAGGSQARWSALLAGAQPVHSTVLLLTERAARDSAVAHLVRAVRPAMVVVQGQPRPGSRVVQAAAESAVRRRGDLEPRWHFTATDGPLRLEARADAIRLVGGEWQPLSRT